MVLFLLALLSMIAINVSLFSHDHQLTRFNKTRKVADLENTFVQRWAWFNICDYAYANNGDGGGPFVNATPFDPEKVKAGDVIFSTAYGIENFLEEVHPKIRHPYILVTLYYGPVLHMRKYVEDPKIIAWFGQVNRDAITFEKFTAIPLGILRDEQYFEQSKKYNDFFKQMRNKQKTKLAYVNFTVHEGRFDGRGDIYNLFKDEPFCMVSRPKPFLDYMDETAQCKFVISPEGDMHDCYRHWEALLVGTIPVVHASPADCLFDELPVVIVNDYKEVNEEFLHKKYEELKHKNYNFRKLYMQYWIDKIDAAREKFFASQRN